VEVHLDGERVFADEQRLHGFDSRPRHGAGGPGLSEARESGVGINPDQAVAGDVLDRHLLDAGDLDLAALRRGQCLIAREIGTGG
jgi:hypothetical protein